MNPVWATVRADLFKALRKRRTYVLAGLWWVLLPSLLLLLASVVQANFTGSFIDGEGVASEVVQALGSPFGLARMHLVAPGMLSPTFYIIAAALFAGFLIGEERSHNMWKTVLTAQPRRVAVLSGKFLVAMLLLGGLMAGAYVSGILFGTLGFTFLETNFSGEWLSLLGLYGLQWLFLGAAMALAFMLIFLVRNVSLGMVMVFFLPALIEGIYSIVRATLQVRPLNRINAFFQALELQVTFETLPRYFFTSNLYAPSRRPLRDVAALLGDEAMQDGALGSFLNLNLDLNHAATVMFVYGAIFLALVFWSFLRRDVS